LGPLGPIDPGPPRYPLPIEYKIDPRLLTGPSPDYPIRWGRYDAAVIDYSSPWDLSSRLLDVVQSAASLFAQPTLFYTAPSAYGASLTTQLSAAKYAMSGASPSFFDIAQAHLAQAAFEVYSPLSPSWLDVLFPETTRPQSHWGDYDENVLFDPEKYHGLRPYPRPFPAPMGSAYGQ
jgi:hypothetical protein